MQKLNSIWNSLGKKASIDEKSHQGTRNQAKSKGFDLVRLETPTWRKASSLLRFLKYHRNNKINKKCPINTVWDFETRVLRCLGICKGRIPFTLFMTHETIPYFTSQMRSLSNPTPATQNPNLPNGTDATGGIKVLFVIILKRTGTRKQAIRIKLSPRLRHSLSQRLFPAACAPLWATPQSLRI